MAIEVGIEAFYGFILVDKYDEKLNYNEDNDYHTLKITDKKEDNVRLRFIEEPKHVPQNNIVWVESKGKLNIINFTKRIDEFSEEGIMLVSKYPNDIEWGNSPVPMIINNINWSNVSDCDFDNVIDTIMVNKIIVQPNSVITGYKNSKNFTINNIIVADGKVKSQPQTAQPQYNTQALNSQPQVPNMFQVLQQQSGMQNSPVVFDINNAINELNASIANNNECQRYESVFGY